MIVQDIVNHALTLIGRLGPGRTPGIAESGWGFKMLNAQIDAWKAERLMIYAILRSVFPINSNQQTYVIGTAGTVDYHIERPERIEAAGYIFPTFTPPLEVPFRILQTQEWEAVSPKELTSTIPYFLYYEPFVPNGNVILYPVPTQAATLALYLWQSVNQFTALTDPVIVAPAYYEALVYSLAVRLAPQFPDTARLDPSVMAMAIAAVSKVKTINSPALLMQTQSAARGYSDRGGHYNILTNRWT